LSKGEHWLGWVCIVRKGEARHEPTAGWQHPGSALEVPWPPNPPALPFQNTARSAAPVASRQAASLGCQS